MITFGIIGGGMIANFHAQAIQNIPNVKLGGIYARRAEQATLLAQKYNCLAYDDLDELLLNDDIDIVTIATPSGTHLEVSLSAARAGKHIICEKPLEITPNRIRHMMKVADENQVILSGIFNRRFNPAVQALKQAVDSGRFGTIAIADANVKWFRDQAYYDSGKWRGTWQLDGGGALMNQSIHTIDLLLYIVGEVARLSATMATLTHEGIEVEDTAVAILEFKNGARGSIQGSTSCWSKDGLPAEIQICGEFGTVIMTDDTFRVWDFKTEMKEDEWVLNNLMYDNSSGQGANDPSAINFKGHQLNFENAIEAIEKNIPPFINATEALKSVQLINEIYTSARNEGQWINCSS